MVSERQRPNRLPAIDIARLQLARIGHCLCHSILMGHATKMLARFKNITLCEMGKQAFLAVSNGLGMANHKIGG